MYLPDDDAVLTATGSPIQKSPDQRMFSSSPRLIATFYVFLRLLAPRHPPFALSSLATISTNKFKRFDTNISITYSIFKEHLRVVLSKLVSD